VGLSDYVIKILGGDALTFGFITIALRRRFERKKEKKVYLPIRFISTIKGNGNNCT
jgi:hypothetical protein